MKTTLGGISMPRPPPAATVPLASASSYLKRRISGSATAAIVAAVAGPEPQMAPKAAHAPTVAIARPPRKPESQLFAAANRRRLIPL
jgi:hypothetical protein